MSRPEDTRSQALPDRRLAEFLPPSTARELRVVPFMAMGQTLVVAGPDRLSESSFEHLRFILNRAQVRQIIRPEDWFEDVWQWLYAHDSGEQSESSDRSWYWGNWSHFADDGTLVIKASGWEGMCHWSGVAEYPPNHADYAMWCWIVRCPHYARLIDDREIPAIRRIWKRWQTRRQASGRR